jgi:energy-coupling factor transporter ATP-binding protein EcfA2
LADFAPVLFQEHLRQLRWSQGEHVVLSGPTGSGKTTLAKSLLEKRGHVVGFAVKAKDPTLMEEFSDWEFVEDFTDIENWMNRVMVWPRPRLTGPKKEDADAWTTRKRKTFKYAFDKLMMADGWGVYVDELAYMSNPKYGGVGNQIEQMHYIARSAKTSVLSCVQRPAFVPLAVMSNASHAYIAKTHMAEDLKRLSNLGGVDQKKLSTVVTGLPTRHDFVYQPTLVEGRPGIINTHR